MKLGFHTRIEVGRLFSSLEYGERIACECAGEQARIAGDERGRFFVRQARQENHHAEVFRQVVRCVTPFRPRPVPGSLQRYRQQLRRAWCRGDAVDLLVGQQLVLETLGEVILTRMDRKFDQRGIGFRRLRKILLAQEQGHHAFGEHMLKGMIDAGGVDPDQVRDRTCEYLFMAEGVLEELGGVFDAVGADPGVYVAALHRQLAHWTGT